MLSGAIARRPRVHFPGALYHVISRGNQRQKVYKDEHDYRRFQTTLVEVGKRHAVTLYAYVLMPNHFRKERGGIDPTFELVQRLPSSLNASLK